MLYSLNDRRIKVGCDVFIAPDATVIGSVELGDCASVWFNSVIRGDNDVIRIGDNTNVQDGCVIHTDPGFPVHIGANVTIGHKAMLHGCTIGDGCLVGINSVILNGAQVGEFCIIGSSALITEGKQIPDRSLVIGSPGRVARSVTDEEVERMLRNAQVYVSKIQTYRHEFQEMRID